MVSLFLSPVGIYGNPAHAFLLQQFCGTVILVLVRVSNDLNLAVEPCERVGLICLLLLRPVMQNEVILPRGVVESVPGPLIDGLLEVSLLSN